LNPARTDGGVGPEQASVLSEVEENALQAVKELVAAIRLGGSAADIETIARALSEAGGHCASGSAETGRRVDCGFRGARFSLTSGPSGEPVEIEFEPAE
jgi:hypothetical protein